MRPRSVLSLFVIVAALLAFIWFYERQLPSSDEREELAKKAMPLDAGEVDAIEVERDGQRVRLVRESRESNDEQSEDDLSIIEDEWRLVKPFESRADVDLVNSLLDEVDALQKLRELDETEASEAGLDAPRASLTLHTASGIRRLHVGSQVPASGTMIVRVDEGRLLVVSDSIWSSLSHEPGDWRSKDLYLGDRDAIETATLEADGERIRLARRGDAFWIEEPLVDRADKERVRELLGSIVGLRVDTFIDDPPVPLANLGLEPPRARLEIGGGVGQERFTLDWGEAVDEATGPHYARLDGQVFETSAPLEESLELSPEQWRSRALTVFETHEIDSLRVRDDKGELVLQREGADWLRDEEGISFTAVSDLLYALVDAEAIGFETLGENGGSVRGEPMLEITISGAETEEVLTIGPAIETGVSARTGSREAVLMLAPELLEEIRTKLDAVRSAAPIGEESPTPSAEESEGSD